MTSLISQCSRQLDILSIQAGLMSSFDRIISTYSRCFIPFGLVFRIAWNKQTLFSVAYFQILPQACEADTKTSLITASSAEIMRQTAYFPRLSLTHLSVELIHIQRWCGSNETFGKTTHYYNGPKPVLLLPAASHQPYKLRTSFSVSRTRSRYQHKRLLVMPNRDLVRHHKLLGNWR